MHSPLFYAVPKLLVINMHSGSSKQSLYSWLYLYTVNMYLYLF